MAKMFSPPKIPSAPAVPAAAAPLLPAEPPPASPAPAQAPASAVQPETPPRNPIASESPALPAPPAPAVNPAQDEEDKVKAMELSLSRRDRSRIGTVLTSWRGVLQPGAHAVPRKKLLGE